MSSTGPIDAVPSADDNTPLSTDNTNIAAVPLPNSPNSVSDGSHASPIPSPEDLLPTIRRCIVFAIASSGRDEYRDFNSFINLALAAFLIYGFVLPCLLGYESTPAGAGALGFYLGVIYLVALTDLVYERVKKIEGECRSELGIGRTKNTALDHHFVDPVIAGCELEPTAFTTSTTET